MKNKTNKREALISTILNDTLAKVKSDLDLGDKSFLSAIILGEGFTQLNNLSDEMLEIEANEIFAIAKAENEKSVIEYSSNKTLHNDKSGKAYYNYQGNHFRVFKNFEDGREFCESEKNRGDLVIAEFETEEEMDEYLDSSTETANENDVDINFFIGQLEQADLIMVDGTYLHSWNLSDDKDCLIDTNWMEDELQYECKIEKANIKSIIKNTNNSYMITHNGNYVENITLFKTSYL